MSDGWTPRLSAYLDGELGPAEREALEVHLPGCPVCRTTLAELNAVVRWARAHPGRPPHRDPWPAIAAAIRVETRRAGQEPGNVVRRRPAMGIPQALAAVLVLAIAGVGGWWLGRAADGSAPAVPPAAGTNTASSSEGTLRRAQRYAVAIGELEAALRVGDGALDSATIRVLEEKLRAVDRAIGDARVALAADPSSAYLSDHFVRMVRYKLVLLRRTARLAAVQGT